MTAQASTAFISYCREDAAFALKIAQDLKAAGADVWLDKLDIVPGERWDSSVEHALTACRRMLVVLTPLSVASTNVMDEVSFALEEGKTVIPILYQDCTVPFRLRRVQYVDFREDYGRPLQELAQTLRQGELSMAGAEPLPAVPTPPVDLLPADPSDPEPIAVELNNPLPPAPELSPPGSEPEATPAIAAPPAPDLGTSPPLASEPQTTTQSGFVVAVAVVMLAISVFHRCAALIVVPFVNEWNLSYAQVGAAFAAGTAGVMLGCLVGGFLGDHFGRRPILLANLLLVGLASLLMAHINSVMQLAFLRLVMGVGFGAAIPNALALSFEYVSQARQTLAVVVTAAGMTIGGVIAGSAGAALMQVLGWRSLLTAQAAASILLAVVMWKLLPESAAYIRGRGAYLSTTVMAPAHLRSLLVFGVAFFFCVLAVTLQTLIVQAPLYAEGPSSLGLFVAPIVSVVLALGAAALAPPHAFRTTVLGSTAAAAVLSLALPQIGHLYALAALTGVAGAAQILLYAFATRSFAQGIRTTGVGIIAALGVISSMLGGQLASSGPLALRVLSPLAFALAVGAIFMTRDNTEPQTATPSQ